MKITIEIDVQQEIDIFETVKLYVYHKESPFTGIDYEGMAYHKLYELLKNVSTGE